jgi:hypothetical protein
MCSAATALTVLSSVQFTSTVADSESSKYSDMNNWAYFAEGEDKDADVFFIAPTVDKKDEALMNINDEVNRERFLGALEMERGILDENARLFAPYYSQISLKTDALPAEEREELLQQAYADVSEAFEYYLENENNGRPVILFGFSQGADMCYRLMKEYFSDDSVSSKLVATYAIGWGMSDEEAAAYPFLQFAQNEDDTGVIVSFECEAPEVTDSYICPKGKKMLSINPLSWATDSTPADKSLNKGACFMERYRKEIKNEIPQLCGCYIDENRGVLKVTDVSKEEYPAGLASLPDGSYHLYDYQFFFRNLQENVGVRITAYKEKNTEAEVTTTTTASTETTTTTSNETTVTATEAANSDPGTGDSGVAIPIVFLSLAAGTALVMRKKSD